MSVNFSENQTIFLTNKCDLSCSGCIVYDKETNFDLEFFNEKLVFLLQNNWVKNVRLSWWEIFTQYEKLTDFIELLKKWNIDLKEIFTNSFSEKIWKTDDFLKKLSNLWFNPIFNLSIDDIHPNNIEQNISLIQKLEKFWTKKIVVNSSSFTKKMWKNLWVFLKKLEELKAEKIEDTPLYKKYILWNLEIIINIKWMYKVDNFEKNILEVQSSFWNFPMIFDNFIKAIWYNWLAYLSETYAYTWIDFWYKINDNWEYKIWELQNQKLLDFISKNPLIKLFEKIQKEYPKIKKEYFNVWDEFIIWILKQKINLENIL